MPGENGGPGKDSAFTIPLPTPDTPAAAGPALQEPQGDRAARRALIIEDNFDASDTLREILEFGGHVVEVAYSGPQGLAKARAFRPDIVLCDIGLPGMDGYAVARALREDPTLGHVALLALTGYAEPEDVARARDAGFDAHLVKPPSIQALLQLVGALEAHPGGAP